MDKVPLHPAVGERGKDGIELFSLVQFFDCYFFQVFNGQRYKGFPADNEHFFHGMVLLGDDEFFRTGATVRSVSDDVLLAAIEEVVLPKVSSIGSGAFNYCTNRKKLDIGGAVTKIKIDLILVIR